MKHLLILLLLSISSAGEAICSIDDSEVQKMIERLRLEVACASSSSPQECQNLMSSTLSSDALGKIQQNQIDKRGSCDPSISGELLPLPALSAINHMAIVLDQPNAVSKDVKSVEDFYAYTQKHRTRVRTLGLELYRMQPERFAGLSEEQVSRLLDAHDAEKVSAKYTSPDGRPFYQTLYEGYGKKIDRAVIDHLNETGKNLREQLLKDMGLAGQTDLLAKLDQIEKVADLVDRGMAPETAAEFGRAMDKASSFMKNEDDRLLARTLEDRYFALTKDQRFKGLSPLTAARLHQRLVIEEAFAKAVASKGSQWLSARTLAGGALSGIKRFSKETMKVVSSRGLANALKIADPLLLIAQPSDLACSGLGHHDWIQDPNCKPAIGLTPKFIEFLSEDWGHQKKILAGEKFTCEVLKKTYQESLRAPKLSSCGKNAVRFEALNGETIQIFLETKNQAKNLRSSSTKHSDLLERDHVSEICHNQKFPIPKTKCYPAGVNTSADAKEYLQTLNYQIQKAIRCCRPLAASTIEVQCSR